MSEKRVEAFMLDIDAAVLAHGEQKALAVILAKYPREKQDAKFIRFLIGVSARKQSRLLAAKGK